MCLTFSVISDENSFNCRNDTYSYNKFICVRQCQYVVRQNRIHIQYIQMKLRQVEEIIEKKLL